MNGEVRVYTLGFVGMPAGGPRPDDKHAPFVLSIGSADLVAGGEGLGFDVEYSVLPTRATKVEAAMRSPYLVW